MPTCAARAQQAVRNRATSTEVWVSHLQTHMKHDWKLRASTTAHADSRRLLYSNQESSLPFAHSSVYLQAPNSSTSELSNSRLLSIAGHQVPGACRQQGPAVPPAASRRPCGACSCQR